jgi:hypothetical protein
LGEWGEELIEASCVMSAADTSPLFSLIENFPGPYLEQDTCGTRWCSAYFEQLFMPYFDPGIFLSRTLWIYVKSLKYVEQCLGLSCYKNTARFSQTAHDLHEYVNLDKKVVPILKSVLFFCSGEPSLPLPFDSPAHGSPQGKSAHHF